MSRPPLAERLADSKRKRAELLDRLGMIPTSILKLSRGELSKSIYNMATEHRGRRLGGVDSLARIDAMTTEEGKAVARERRELGVFGGIREASKAADRTSLSIMPAELVAFVLRYYAPDGGLYVDPFVGQGVQAQVAGLLGYDYVGTDVCAEFIAYTQSALDKLTERKRITSDVRVHHADARTIDTLVEPRTATISFTSPPYWDIEFYDDDDRQLGTGHDYDEFLDGMTDVYRALLPTLADDAYVIVNVNDIRRDRRFIPYHSDLTQRLQSIGYVMHDTWIVDGLVGGLPRAFAVDFNGKRIAPKVHEYLLVFRPGART